MQLLAAQNGARINLAEDDSISQNKAESKTYSEHNLARVSTPERDIKLIEDKDNRIKELEELVKQGSWVSNKTIFLPSKFALQIYQTTSVNRSAGTPSEFNLEHDGNQVIKVKEVIKKSESTS